MAWYDHLVTVAPKSEPVVEKKVADVAKPVTVVPNVTNRSSAIDASLSDVMALAGAKTGRNSAETIVKLKEGLAGFTEAQQLAMLRAMDLADDSWNETDVLADANCRVAALNQHLVAITADESEQINQVLVSAEANGKSNDDLIASLDMRITELTSKRDEVERAKAELAINARADADRIRIRASASRDQVNGVIGLYRSVTEFFNKK